MMKYHGLCVNGPMSGRSAAAETNRMRIPILQTVAPLKQSEIPGPLLTEDFEYVFTVIEILNVRGQRLGFWVPSDVKGDRTLYVINELANAYTKGR